VKNEERTTRRLAHRVHITLQSGLVASGLLLIAGLLLALITDQPRPEAVPPGMRSLLRRALRANGVAMLYLGLVLLMLTPVARVVVLGTGWLLEGQRRFALVALCVLVLLAVSVALGVG
jgi:uncharacterized membrane protein